MSKTTSFLSEIAERKPIPSDKLAYFQARLRHNLYDFVIAKFEEMARTEGLTKAELARRLECDPVLITRRLGAPGNWTLDTISDLLIGIAGEELEPQSKSVLGLPTRNYDGSAWRNLTVKETGAPAKSKDAKKRPPRSAASAREDGGEQAINTYTGLIREENFGSRMQHGTIITGPSEKLASRELGNA